jgi:putative isomerase
MEQSRQTSDLRATQWGTAYGATRDQVRRVKEHVLNFGKTCIHKPQGQFKHEFVTPTAHIKPGVDDESDLPERSNTGRYAQMYDWDACLFSQAFAEVNPGLRLSVVLNFLALQEVDGYIPRTASPGRVWDSGDNCKPFLCQTLNSITNLDRQTFATVIPQLRRWLDYYNRHHRRSGLFAWDDVLESGVDSNLALLQPRVAAKDRNLDPGAYREQDILAVDLAAYLVLEFNAFADLLDRSGQPDRVGDLHESTDWRRLASETAEQIEKRLWCDELGMYVNYDAETGAQIPVRSWTGLTPVLLGLASKERTETVLERHLLNPKSFFLEYGIPSMSADSKLFNNAVRGLYGQVVVSNWQGPIWVLPNAWAIELLRREKLYKEATALALRMTRTLATGIATQGTTFENYHALTGEGLWARDFISWNAMALDWMDILE